MNKPNLFNYATSELSQDAMICYMLEWAKEEYKEIDEQSHNIGKKLLNAFFDKHSITIPRYNSIVIKKQEHQIDVLCIINDTYYIIIEDKTNTSEHDNQLHRYFNVISKKDIPEENILCIYYKSGEEYNLDILGQYKLFSKNDILNVLNIETKNQILIEYTKHIEKLYELSDYKNLNIEKWEIDTWICFVRNLKENISNLNMGKNITHGKGVNKGIYFNYTIINQIGYYLRISFDTNQIEFKMESEGAPLSKELGLKYLKLINKNKSVIQTTLRSNALKTMTVAKTDSFLIENNGLLDYEQTINYLQEIVKVHNEILKEIS